ncbi:AMP-binding protein [Bosea sp. (in: a-proteobacteria)]|uniref:AMP-binding protein n=1 Tax=Bosea sp. (in: a-proteobacteria) TaxID=1871050 RepID=UPI002616E6BB|nr:AMP-binding protein [Bosea sp. (in: a-proteobacteria)]MCO5089580.1 AMP-binding protein [Bosea sp. (in: a-proteobacteria)]
MNTPEAPVIPVDDALSLPRVLIGQAERHGDKPLLIFPRTGEHITYAGLVAAAEAGSTRLRTAFAIPAGTTAAIFLGNQPAFVEAWFICLFAGIVDVPVNHELRRSALLFALATARVEVIVTDADGFAALLDPEVAGYLAQLRLIILTEPCARGPGPPGGNASCAVVALTELAAPGPADGLWRAVQASALASIRYTSGTTGNPKGIMHSHLHMLAKSAVQNRILEFAGTDLLYSPFPLHHNLSSINGLIGALQAGATMASAGRFSASRYWPEIRDCGATLGHILPPLMPILLSQPEHPDDRRHAVRHLWTAPRSERFNARFGVETVTSYSLSEVGTIAHRRDGGTEGSPATGVPSPDMTVAIVDAVDRPLPPGEDGEIVIRPQHPYRMLLGYYNDLPATLRAFRNCWYHTGDRGLIDSAGELHFLGRMGDTIRRRGLNISADQIGAEILRHPMVTACAVIGVPSPLGDEDILAVIVPQPSAQEPEHRMPAPLLAELPAFLAERLPRTHVPRFFEFTASLPRTETGKVRLAEVRRMRRTGPVWDRETQQWIGPDDCPA